MELLRGNRAFRRLLAGQVVSELGNWFNFIAGLGLVRAVTGAAPEATAALVVARMAPFALFAPLAGAFVDRWSRRTVMIAADAARAVFALGFLLVRSAEDLWIAYLCTVASTLLAAFFDAAKTAATPNIVGDRGLLAGNGLMHTSRFLLMTVGSAMGGAASAGFGYEVAFIINALSFIVSAYSIWLITDEEMRADVATDGAEMADAGEAAGENPRRGRAAGAGVGGFWADLREGWAYILSHQLVAALIGINVAWATGGGAINLVYDRLGGVVFAGEGSGWGGGDAAVALIYTTVGAGLFTGMLGARRIGAKVELRGLTPQFIGWALVAHGIFFALAGLMPSLWTACLMIFLSRVVIGIEFAVHETLMMRLLPDGLRGRVISSDRAGEIFMMSLSGLLAGWALHVISPRTLTVISGLLSASPGAIWLLLFASGKLRMPSASKLAGEREPSEETAVAPAG